MAWVDTLGAQAPFNPGAGNDAKFMGTEIDLGLRASFAGTMHFSLESGYLRYGGFLKAILPNADSSFTLQTRVAFIW